MSANWFQIYTANPTTTFNANDVFYLARSPYGPTDNFGFTYANLIPVNTKGDIFTWSSTGATKLPVGSANGQLLQVNSAAATGLAWSTATYPVIAGTAGTFLQSNGTNFINSTALTNGQLFIGSTGSAPAQTTLTAGSNIAITNGAGSISIGVTGITNLTWNTVNTPSQTAAVNNGYIIKYAPGLVTIDLPSTSAIGDRIAIVGVSGTIGWKLQCGLGQTIYIGNASTNTGITGYIASTDPTDALELICTTANQIWETDTAPQGNIYLNASISGNNNALNNDLSSCHSLNLSAGQTGTLPATNGGTGNNTYTLGDTLYSSATNILSKLAGNTSISTLYLSQTGNGVSSAAPIWSAISGSDVTGAALSSIDDINISLTFGGSFSTALLRAASIMPVWAGQLAVSRGGTGRASLTSNSILLGNGTNAVAFLSLGAGQIPIGTTSAAPAAATLTAGTGINISSVSGAITISQTGSGSEVWNTVTIGVLMDVNNGYMVNSSSSLGMVLPTTAAVGEFVELVNQGSGLMVINQNSGQQIVSTSGSTTVGVTGTLTANSQYASIRLRCMVANTTWVVSYQAGNFTAA